MDGEVGVVKIKVKVKLVVVVVKAILLGEKVVEKKLCIVKKLLMVRCSKPPLRPNSRWVRLLHWVCLFEKIPSIRGSEFVGEGGQLAVRT